MPRGRKVPCCSVSVLVKHDGVFVSMEKEWKMCSAFYGLENFSGLGRLEEVFGELVY